MSEIKSIAYELLQCIYYKEIKPLLVERENYAYLSDPVFNIKRNRVVGEVLKAIVRSEFREDKKLAVKLYRYLEKTQNEDGSWNEIHPRYNNPSALVTSIVGEAFILGLESGFVKNEQILHKAKDYVLEKELEPGFFLKSEKYTADHLNVDATCGAFLAKYGDVFFHEKSLKAAERASERIVNYQFDNGAYPYTTNKGSYLYLLKIPCVHYQGVTLYYLLKINESIRKKWLRNSLLRGGEWLSKLQCGNGRFDWSKSGLMFSYYLIGAYAFAFSSFLYLSKWEKKYLNNARLCLNVLESNIHGLCLRWERDIWASFPFSISTSLKTALIGGYPFKHKLFRFGYGLYRQMARRRLAEQINDNFFQNLTKVLNLKTSTIEPFSNYPDLFMTSEVIDCLSSI